MRTYKYFPTTKFLLFAFVALLFSVDAEAQVVVDVSKITCDQFATTRSQIPNTSPSGSAGTITALAEI